MIRICHRLSLMPGRDITCLGIPRRVGQVNLYAATISCSSLHTPAHTHKEYQLMLFAKQKNTNLTDLRC